MDNIILPNWILGKKVMDFLFQEECNAKKISETMVSLISDKEQHKKVNNFSSDLKKLLTANDKTFNENLSQTIKQSLI
jgi:lipid A disaccharide synthetase